MASSVDSTSSCHPLSLGIPACSLILFSHCTLFLQAGICAYNFTDCVYVAESQVLPSIPGRSPESHRREFSHLFGITAYLCSLHSACPREKVSSCFLLGSCDFISGSTIHPVSLIRNLVYHPYSLKLLMSRIPSPNVTDSPVSLPLACSYSVWSSIASLPHEVLHAHELSLSLPSSPPSPTCSFFTECCSKMH